jgi:hypothetical protein
MWPCYFLFFQLSTSSIITSLSHIDNTGITQTIAMLIVYFMHFIIIYVTWPKNIKTANYILMASCFFRFIFLILTLCLYIGNSGHPSRIVIEILIIITILFSVLPPLMYETLSSISQLNDFIRIMKKKMFKTNENLIFKKSFSYRMKKKYKLYKNKCCKKCFCLKWCCVEDYMNDDVDKETKDKEEEEKKKEPQKKSIYDFEEESEESDVDDIIVVEEDPMKDAEDPKDEIIRLRKALKKQGFTTRAAPMLGRE